jgi:hypothetical protein
MQYTRRTGNCASDPKIGSVTVGSFLIANKDKRSFQKNALN